MYHTLSSALLQSHTVSAIVKFSNDSTFILHGLTIAAYSPFLIVLVAQVRKQRADLRKRCVRALQVLTKYVGVYQNREFLGHLQPSDPCTLLAWASVPWVLDRAHVEPNLRRF